MPRHLINDQFRGLVRFGIVGVLLNLVAYLVYLVVTLFLHPQTAITLIYPVALIASYYSHRHWSFQSAVSGAQPMVRYGVIFLAGYLTNLLLLFVASEKLGLPHQLVQAACIFIVGGQTYVLGRIWVFKAPQSQPMS